MENTLPSFIFTFIANYKGGVYVRQVVAKNMLSACHSWAEQVVSHQDIPKLNREAFLQAFKDDIELLEPVPLQNSSNIWAFSVANRRTFMLVNIVKTAAGGEQPVPVAAATQGGSSAKP